MSHPRKRSVTNQVLVQLVESDVEAGFRLVDVALSETCRGNPDFSSRALQQAEATVADIERRLEQLGPEDGAPFQQLIEELRREIQTAKHQINDQL